MKRVVSLLFFILLCFSLFAKSKELKHEYTSNDNGIATRLTIFYDSEEDLYTLSLSASEGINYMVIYNILLKTKDKALSSYQKVADNFGIVTPLELATMCQSKQLKPDVVVMNDVIVITYSSQVN